MIKVRRLLSGDEKLAQGAVNTIKPAEERNHKEVTTEHMRDFLKQDNHVLIMAHEEEHPVGFALAYLLDRVDRDQPMMLFYEIEVLESHKRRGVAAAIINKLKEICQDQNVMKMWVYTSKSNAAAMQLYKSTGGKQESDEDVLFVYEQATSTGIDESP
jgi:aminoglycoside 3-N-acetyltransferase I